MRTYLGLLISLGFLAACDDGGGGGGVVPADAQAREASVADVAVDAAPVDAARDAVVVDMAPRDVAVEDMAPPQDAAPPPLDLAVVADMAPPVDMAPPETPICGACETDRDCPDPTRCTPLLDGVSYCLPTCANMGPCPAAYSCLGDRCLPAGASCQGCAVTGCGGDTRCNTFTGACEPRAGRCGGCQLDLDCVEGLRCTPLAIGANCLEACNQGACPEGFVCQAGVCAPANGFCDNCGGCGGQAPVCDFLTGQCVACGGGVPCPAGRICSPQGACVEPGPGIECNTNVDCQDPARPLCAQATCVACLDDVGCPAGTACMAGACAPADACRSVTCPVGVCDAGVCRLEGGGLACDDDADCPGDGRRCNPLTGQCFRVDQRCDDQNACAPGGQCRPDPFDPMQRVCSCLKSDPANFMEPNDQHTIPCQPGGTCLQLGPEPGACVAAP